MQGSLDFGPPRRAAKRLREQRSTLTLEELSVELHRKAIKNMHLRVYPDGRVRLSAPMRQSELEMERFLRGKLEWIRAHRGRFAERARLRPVEPSPAEARLFKGSYLPLRVDLVEQRAAAKVELLRAIHGAQPSGLLRSDSPPRGSELLSDTLWLRARPDATPAQQEAAILRWYREQLELLLVPMIAHWEAVLGCALQRWGIKQMKSRWGSCNPRERRIWLNLELIKHPPECAEYVLVHELVHLHERGHNPRFYAWLQRFMPDWQARRELLRGKL